MKVYLTVMSIMITVAAEITLLSYAYVMKIRSAEFFARNLTESGRCGMIALSSFITACAIMALVVWVGIKVSRPNIRNDYASREDRKRRDRNERFRKIERIGMLR